MSCRARRRRDVSALGIARLYQSSQRQTRKEGSAVAAPQTRSAISRGALCPSDRAMGLWLLISESWCAVVHELAVRVSLPLPIPAPSFPTIFLAKIVYR